MIQLLLDHGADKTIKATNGKTPLDYAIELDNEPAEKLLK
jgi:ankyrin repeat protein